MVSAQSPLLALDAAFAITFGIFVLALLILAFVTLRWAFRQDRAGFKAWRQRQQESAAATPSPGPAPAPTPTPAPAPGEGDAPPTSTP